MNFNLNYDTAGPIALLLYLALPFASTIINTLNQREIKKLEIIYDKKLAAFGDFSESYGKLHNNDNYNVYWEFVSNTYKLCNFLNDQTTSEMCVLINMIKNNSLSSSEETDAQFIKCVALAQQKLKLIKKTRFRQ